LRSIVFLLRIEVIFDREAVGDYIRILVDGRLEFADPATR
jgi:hypothetical protein